MLNSSTSNKICERFSSFSKFNWISLSSLSLSLNKTESNFFLIFTVQDAYNLGFTAVVIIILLIITTCVRFLIRRMKLGVQCRREDIEIGNTVSNWRKFWPLPLPQPPLRGRPGGSAPAPPPHHVWHVQLRRGEERQSSSHLEEKMAFFFRFIFVFVF